MKEPSLGDRIVHLGLLVKLQNLFCRWGAIHFALLTCELFFYILFLFLGKWVLYSLVVNGKARERERDVINDSEMDMNQAFFVHGEGHEWTDHVAIFLLTSLAH